MLKRLYIDNFRCFVNFEWKPERKQLLLGANGSGKSSLLDAIRLVQNLTRDERSFDAQMRIRAGRTRWLASLNPVFKFELDAEIEGELFSYRLKFDPDQLNPLSELLAADGRPLIEIPDDPDRECALYRSGRPIHFGRGILNPGSVFRTRISDYPPDGIWKFVRWLTEDLHCIDIDPFAMEHPTRMIGRPRLARNLSNIGDWYAHFSQDNGFLGCAERLFGSLREVLDGFISLEVAKNAPQEVDSEGSAVQKKIPERETPGQTPFELRFTFSRNGREIQVWFHELSEGQRTLVALYMILHFLIAKGRTVLLDEPDNFISLREIQPWLLSAEDACDESRGQLILISHNPEILDQWAQEDGLLLIRDETGSVQIEKFKPDPDGLLYPSELVARGWENE